MEMGSSFFSLSCPLGIYASAPAIIALIQVDCFHCLWVTTHSIIVAAFSVTKLC